MSFSFLPVHQPKAYSIISGEANRWVLLCMSIELPKIALRAEPCGWQALNYRRLPWGKAPIPGHMHAKGAILANSESLVIWVPWAALTCEWILLCKISVSGYCTPFKIIPTGLWEETYTSTSLDLCPWAAGPRLVPFLRPPGSHTQGGGCKSSGKGAVEAESDVYRKGLLLFKLSKMLLKSQEF